MKLRLGLSECIFLGASCLLILVGSILRSRAAPLWLDELVAAQLIRDPSLAHCLSALADQVDGVPPFYYLVARVWAALFSASPLSLRLFSAVAICTALVLLFFALRSRFAFWPSALALAFAFGRNSTIRFETANVRFYGLLLALVALAVFLAMRLVAERRPSRGLLVANVFTQAALVLCHPFGGLNSAMILLAVVASDWWQMRRVRIAVIASYIGGWLFLLLWLRQLVHQAAVNNPHGWIPPAGPNDLLSRLDGEINYHGLILLFPIAWLLQMFWSKTQSATKQEPTSSPGTQGQFLLLAAVAILALMPAVWMLSRLNPAHSLFLPRYFIGATAAWAVVLAQLVTYGIGPVPALVNWPMKVVFIIFIALGLHPLLGGSKQFFSYEAATGEVDEAFGHHELPVVFPRSFDYLPRQFYSKHAARYYFLLDWPAATAPTAEPMATSEYKLFDALRRNYSYDHVVQADKFLRDHDSFLVHDAAREWVKLRLTPDKYKIDILGDGKDGGWRMLLVKRKSDDLP